MNSFKLTDTFLDGYKKKQPDWGSLGLVTYTRTYARMIPSENRKEVWWETVRRVVEGCYSIQKDHCKGLKIPWNDHKAQASAQEMYRLMFEMKFLPPGRGLQMMGSECIQVKGAAPLYNCSAVTTKDIATNYAEPFCFIADFSMLGVGVGVDTRGAGTVKIKEPPVGDFTFVVEDSREGWVSLIRTYIDGYLRGSTLPKTVDYAKVRPYGTPIRGLGGTASGPGPLIQLVLDIQEILNPLLGKMITSSAIVDLCCAIGRCVVSGNVRRTAIAVLGDPKDLVYLALKNPEVADPQRIKDWRWASNNSVAATVGMDYSQTAALTAKNGEPGYFWTANAQQYGRLCDGKLPESDELIILMNPCGEANLESDELCNVPETFPGRHESFEEYKRTLKFAYLYAKVVTLLSTHNARTNAVQLRNRKIGLSMSGIVQSIHKHGLREHFRWCDEGYGYLKKLDKTYSDWLCIPRSKKLTSIKPSGSVSLLPGVTPGIHFPISEYYWRCIRMDSGSDLVKALEKAGYKIVPGEGHNTSIVYFPVHEKDFWKDRSQISIWEQLELVAQTQYYWADQSVSVTVTFKPEEAGQIAQALQLYETRLKSVSFLPLEDHGYENAPYQPITKEIYEEAVAKLKPIKLKGITETDESGGRYCDGDHCTLDFTQEKK